jgi:hypothetical protein
LKKQSTKYIILLNSLMSADATADKRTKADAALGQPAWQQTDCCAVVLLLLVVVIKWLLTS